MTGSKPLWRILKCPQVVTSVKLGEDGIQFKSWPAFMNEFPSLVSLQIENSSRQWWCDLGLSLDQLPTTLRKLSLQFQDFSSHFFVSKTTCDAIHLDEHLPHLQVLELRDESASNFDWVSHCPPSLTSLSVHEWKPETALPSSLVHFKSLVSVPNVLPLPWAVREYCYMPFPNLTSLSIFDVSMDDTVQPEQVSSLSRSLIELNFDTALFGSLPTATWPFLPPNLQTLSFYGHFVDCVVTRRVVDPITGEDIDVRTCPLELLPKSLTKLCITENAEDIPLLVSGSISLFPPQLKYFDAPGLRLGPNAANQLPSSLTHLSTYNFYEQLSEHLPEGLTSLKYRRAMLSPKAIKCLPKSLTNLDSSHSYDGSLLSWLDDSKGKWFDYTTGESIDSSTLPEYSVHRDYASYFACLPANLTSLTLHGYKKLKDDFFKNQNFPNLLSLDLNGPDISDESIPLLNRHLTRLEVCPAPNITGKCFKYLPKSLTSLQLSSSVISDEDIQHLPRALKCITMQDATELSDACIRDFPRRCKQVHLWGNGRITQCCIPDLPPAMALHERAFIVEKWIWSCGKVSRH